MPGASKSFPNAALWVATGVLAITGLAGPGMLGPAAAAPTAPTAPTAPQAAPVRWSAEKGPVPGAITNTSPALAAITLPSKASRLLLFWTGPRAVGAAFPISYQTSISLSKNKWSHPGLVDGGKALTASRPATAPVGPQGSGQVIVAWKGVSGPQIFYSIGTAGQGNTVAWNGIFEIPDAITSAGPAVYRPLHSNVILVAWKAASSDAVDFVVGSLAAGQVTWGRIGIIPRAATTTTPAIAEASTSGKGGLIYVLWRGPGRSRPIDFTATADPLSALPRWNAPRALPATVRTGAAPAAQAIGKGLSFPLLVVFRTLRGTAFHYVTLARDGKVTGPLTVPHIRSMHGAAISPGVLAAEAPDPGVFYEPFVRPCAGC